MWGWNGTSSPTNSRGSTAGCRAPHRHRPDTKASAGKALSQLSRRARVARTLPSRRALCLSVSRNGCPAASSSSATRQELAGSKWMFLTPVTRQAARSVPAERSSRTAGRRVCWVASSATVSTRNGASSWSIAPAGNPTAGRLVCEKSPWPNIRPPNDITCPPAQLPIAIPATTLPARRDDDLPSSSVIRFVTRIGLPLRASTR